MQTHELAFLGGDVQQKIADLSDVVFKMDADRLPERVCGELSFAADRLEAKQLGQAANPSAVLDRIAAAREETEKVIVSLKGYLTEVYKADAAYSCLWNTLREYREEIGSITDRLEREQKSGDGNSGAAGDVLVRHISDLKMSAMVAERYMQMIGDRRKYLGYLIGGINSAAVNAFPLWQGAVMSAYENPVSENISRAQSVRYAMISGLRDIVRALDKRIG